MNETLPLFHSGAPLAHACVEALSQYPTPRWVAEAIVDRHFGDLTATDLVLEPCCHEGRFLQALPAHVPAIGVELDPGLAKAARENTGREVLTGDLLEVALPEGLTAVLGNPPFQSSLIERFMGRVHPCLPEGGRVGLILPAYVMQTSSTVMRYAKQWSIAQELLPRNIFPGLKLPLIFALFRKEASRRLVGFLLYPETAQVAKLRTEYRRLLETHNGKASVWRMLVRAAMKALGGQASVAALHAELRDHYPPQASFCREQVRRTLQRYPEFLRLGEGHWALDGATPAPGC